MKTVGGFRTSFYNAVMPSPDTKGDNVSVSGGVDLNGGQKATNTVCGTLVTTVNVNGIGSVSSPVGTGNTIANR